MPFRSAVFSKSGVTSETVRGHISPPVDLCARLRKQFSIILPITQGSWNSKGL